MKKIYFLNFTFCLFFLFENKPSNDPNSIFESITFVLGKKEVEIDNH